MFVSYAHGIKFRTKVFNISIVINIAFPLIGWAKLFLGLAARNIQTIQLLPKILSCLYWSDPFDIDIINIAAMP